VGFLSLFISPFLYLHFFHFIESVNKWETVKPENFFGPNEPDKHNDDAGQLKEEKQIKIAFRAYVNAAGCWQEYTRRDEYVSNNLVRQDTFLPENERTVNGPTNQRQRAERIEYWRDDGPDIGRLYPDASKLDKTADIYVHRKNPDG
jgi:hypothetical protein